MVGVGAGEVTVSGITLPSGMTLNANGTLSIATNVPTGTYIVVYQICENGVTPVNCDTATSTITRIKTGLLITSASNLLSIKDLAKNIV